MIYFISEREYYYKKIEMLEEGEQEGQGERKWKLGKE